MKYSQIVWILSRGIKGKSSFSMTLGEPLRGSDLVHPAEGQPLPSLKPRLFCYPLTSLVHVPHISILPPRPLYFPTVLPEFRPLTRYCILGAPPPPRRLLLPALVCRRNYCSEDGGDTHPDYQFCGRRRAVGAGPDRSLLQKANESPWRVREDGAPRKQSLCGTFVTIKGVRGREGRKRKKRPLQKSNGKESRNRIHNDLAVIGGGGASCHITGASGTPES